MITYRVVRWRKSFTTTKISILKRNLRIVRNDFYWCSQEHSCEVTRANFRIVGGEKLKFVWPSIDSREVSKACISGVVEDVESAALDIKPFNSKADSGPTTIDIFS